jgi:RNA polymerase sigma-70 factor (ECF subfamily)
MAVVKTKTLDRPKAISLSTVKNDPSDDFQLIQSVAAGDDQARRRLFARLYDRVRTSVFYLAAGHPSAEDFIQSSMVEIFLSIHSFRAESALEAWVDRITVRTTMRLIRTDRYKNKIVSLEPAPLQSVPSGTENNLYCRQVLDQIATRMAELKPHHREALTLHMVLGYSAVEAAEITNIKFETMRARLKKARRKLLKLIKNDPMLVERLHMVGK